MKSYLTNLRIFLISLFFLLIFIRCEDEQFVFPHRDFDVLFDINTQLDNLQPGESIIKDERNYYGYGGLIIYRVDHGYFRAYDLACTHKPEKKCLLKRDKDFDTLFKCPCCGSQFMIDNISGDVTVFNGPAKWPLKEYRTSYKPPNQLRVYN
jgi:Rieske Fe-S protein